MVKYFDHVTVVVRDLENAKRFFGLLGFENINRFVISGGKFGTYMSDPGMNPNTLPWCLQMHIPDRKFSY